MIVFPPLLANRKRSKRRSSESKEKDKKCTTEDSEDKEMKEKARIDELWASFKKDTASNIKGKVMTTFLNASTLYPLL